MNETYHRHRLDMLRFVLRYHRSPEYTDVPRFTYGACTKCGQLIQLIQFGEGVYFPDRGQADSYATAQCNCDDALRYQSRDRALRSIRDLFGESSETFGREPVDGEVVEALELLAEKVCAAHIDKATIEVSSSTGAVKAKLSISSKGAVDIQRTDTQKAQRSV